MSPWRVLIVEDDSSMREFFAASVARCEGLTLAATAGSVAQACAYFDEPGFAADVLLTDLGLPDGSGLDVIRYARQRQPLCEALVISMFGDEDNVLASIEAGALGYIHKDATPDDISHTILEMKAGASPISPMIARRLLARFQGGMARRALERPSLFNIAVPNVAGVISLSDREQEVLDLIARGFSYGEIARVKSITMHTVQSHIKSLYRKLEVHSRSEAVYEATRMGLLAKDRI
jgi:DNA-binding NarL/FixJ family response regulator